MTREVLLITVDCLRPDRLGLYGGRDTSPHLDALAAQGIVFEHVEAQSSWTSPAMFSLFTGCTPSAHGVTSRGGIVSSGLLPMPALFRHHGWTVPNVCYLNAEQSYARLGWDAYRPLETEMATATRGGRLLWTHYDGCHLPYRPRPETLQRFRTAPLPPAASSLQAAGILPRTPGQRLAVDRDTVLDLYDAVVRDMDAWLGATLERWGGRGPVIITADHGEALLERGWVGHTSTAEWPTLHREVLRIPLILWGWGCGRVSSMVRQIDILPTLAELLDIPLPARVEGQSLVAAMRGGAVVVQPSVAETVRAGYRTRPEDAPHRVRSWTDGRWKRIHATCGDGALYDLAADPLEQVDVSPAHPQKVAELDAALYAHVHSSRSLWKAAAVDAAVEATSPSLADAGDALLLTLAETGSQEIEYEMGVPPAAWTAGTLYTDAPHLRLPRLLPARLRARRDGGAWSSWVTLE